MERVKQKMQQAHEQRKLLQGQNYTNIDQPEVSIPDSRSGPRKKPLKTIWLSAAAIAWIATLIAARLSGSSVSTRDAGLNDLDNARAERGSEVAEIKTHIATSMELGKHLDDLDGRIQMLSDTIASAEAGLMRVLVLTDSMPAPASGSPSVALQQPSAPGKSGTLATAITKADKPASNGSGEPGVVQNDAAGSGKQAAVNTGSAPPWVVNLASLPDRADADRFAENVRSKGIQAEMHAVVIKGREYWRVQATGFSTETEARSQAGIIRKKPGLKDAWVTKR